MKNSKLFIIIIFLSFITEISHAQKTKSDAPFFFIQLTDPQFGRLDQNAGFANETELYERAIKEVNRLHPDFVVITGDLVNAKNNQSQIDEFKRITSEISSDIPVYYTPGNHDVGQSPSREDIDLFVANYGFDRFSFKHKGSLFIGINSSIIKSATPILEQQQFDWLKNEISENKGFNHILLFCHYPVFIDFFDEPDTYSNFPVQTREKYLDLFKEYRVDAVFAGHLHDNKSTKFGNMKMITTSSISTGNAPSGFRIVKVWPDSIASTFYGLDEMPASVISQDN